MEYAHYVCTLTASGLSSFRKTKNDPLEKIRIILQNINIDDLTTDSDAIILVEHPDAGILSYAKWLSFMMGQDGLSLRLWVQPESEEYDVDTFGSVGMYCPQKQWVWYFSEEPAPLFKITPEAFLDFIDQQTDPEAFRKAVLSSVSDYSQSNFAKPVVDIELNNFIHSTEGRIFFEYNGDSLWYDIREHYVDSNRSIIIEGKYRDLIYEIDDSYFDGKKSYGFEESANRTATLSFKLLHHPPESLFQQSVIDDDKFRQGLSIMAGLAAKINSPFKDAFTSSISILELSQKNLSLKDLVDTCETTTEGREIINSQAGVLKYFEDFGVNSDVLSRLLACEVSDVYGGMGSWNDQHIQQEYQDEYSKISSDFYTVLMKYKAAVICSLV